MIVAESGKEGLHLLLRQDCFVILKRTWKNYIAKAACLTFISNQERDNINLRIMDGRLIILFIFPYLFTLSHPAFSQTCLGKYDGNHCVISELELFCFNAFHEGKSSPTATHYSWFTFSYKVTCLESLELDVCCGL